MKSKPVRVYSYSRCATCRKALSWLDSNKIEYELIDIFQEKRYANYSMYDKEIPWENIVSNKLQAVKNVWGIDVEWDNPILDELIRMNDTTKENQYLREQGLKTGISKVIDDLALSEVGAYGEGIVQGQAFTEGGS